MTNEFGKRKKDVSKYRRPTGTNLTPRLSRVIRFIEDVVSCGTVALMVFIVIIICYYVVKKNIRSLTTVPQLVSTSPPAVIETETKDAIEEEILESFPKTMKTKAELLVRTMKADPNIAWREKGELKYKGETVRGRKEVDLVNDVPRKRKYFNPQGWETFGEALREANVPQDLIGHEDRWRYISQTKRTPRFRKRQ